MAVMNRVHDGYVISRDALATQQGVCARLSGKGFFFGLTRDQVLEAHARHESSQQKYTPGRRYQELLPNIDNESFAYSNAKLQIELTRSSQPKIDFRFDSMADLAKAHWQSVLNEQHWNANCRLGAALLT